jgi:phosphotransacetylase
MNRNNLISEAPVVCPSVLLDQAQNLSASTAAVVNAGSVLAMQSAKLAFENKVINPVLVGDESTIKKIAQELLWDVSEIRIVHAASDIDAAATAVALARNGEVSTMMKGDIHTDDLLRAVLNREHGLTIGSRLSHVFHMTKPDSNDAICISDAVINVAPSVDVKLDIARNAVRLCHALGNARPKVAVLSATEVPSAAMPSSLEAEQVSQEAQAGAVPGADVYGPLAFDNAVSGEAAKLKGITHPVAGNADILLVPNIETGNALFKQMVYYMSAAAAGVVLGAKVPIVLTSRADPAAARLAGAALATIVSNQ